MKYWLIGLLALLLITDTVNSRELKHEPSFIGPIEDCCPGGMGYYLLVRFDGSPTQQYPCILDDGTWNDANYWCDD